MNPNLLQLRWIYQILLTLSAGNSTVSSFLRNSKILTAFYNGCQWQNDFEDKMVTGPTIQWFFDWKISCFQLWGRFDSVVMSDIIKCLQRLVDPRGSRGSGYFSWPPDFGMQVTMLEPNKTRSIYGAKQQIYASLYQSDPFQLLCKVLRSPQYFSWKYRFDQIQMMSRHQHLILVC